MGVFHPTTAGERWGKQANWSNLGVSIKPRIQNSIHGFAGLLSFSVGVLLISKTVPKPFDRNFFGTFLPIGARFDKKNLYGKA